MPIDKFKLSCNFCKLPGHSEDQCYKKKNFQSGQYNKRPPQRVNCTYEQDVSVREEPAEFHQEKEEITMSETEFQPYPDDCFQYEQTCTDYED